MIDEGKIKNFWEERGRRFASPVAEMANLEPDTELQCLKTRLEQEVISSKLDLHPDMRILDLGAGYGQWAFRFAPHAKAVCAVEYAKSMLDAGQKEALNKGITNITFVHSSAEHFNSDVKWDLVFISGLFMYLNDKQGHKVAENAMRLLASGGRVFLRESVSLLPGRHIINNEWSKAAQANYSALYRKSHEFVELFSRLKLLDEGYFFPDGNPLNKWRETRLKYFLFEKGEEYGWQ